MAGAREDRVALAVAALREFMDQNLAASKIELEAKLIESHFDNVPFEPAHLQDARNVLLASEELIIERRETRGGSRPPILVTTDQRRRARRVENASARKRLLMSRYYSYVQGGQTGSQSLTGDAGELAFHAAFLRASVGPTLATLTRGVPSVQQILGMQVDLDNAFVLTPLDKITHAPVPPYGIQVLVEVKNLREWIYPRTQELYQVLDKAARLQAAHPTASFLPVLVCRRVQQTTLFMAAELGFFVIDARRHYFPQHAHIDPEALRELSTELGLADITQENGSEQTRRIEQKLVTLQRYVDLERAIERWKTHAGHPDFRELVHTLNDDELPNTERDRTLNKLRALATNEFGLRGGW